MNAIAAQHQQIAVRQAVRGNVGVRNGAVAHHARRVVGRTAARRCFVQVREGVVAREQIDVRRAALREPVGAAVPDPGDQPLRGQRVRRCTQDDRRGARRIGDACDATSDAAVSLAHRVADCVGIGRTAIERRVELCDELAARHLRHRAAADTVGDDEEVAWPRQRTVRVFVARVLTAASGRRRCLDAAQRRRMDPLLSSGGRVGRRRHGARGARLQRGGQWAGHEPRPSESVQVGSSPGGVPSAIVSPTFQWKRAPGG